eukprot:GHVT01002366.1.p1 GENE.GHVT01002366.1~~GHVT01002366.1.p1  ORF type:complete len:812 (+),score=99.41 GHVT01002366.1:1580-4015(+)
MKKTKLCKSWKQNGYCNNGAQCSYAHGPTELRDIGKPAICQLFREGGCSLGGECTFAHSVCDIQTTFRFSSTAVPSERPSSEHDSFSSHIGAAVQPLVAALPPLRGSPLDHFDDHNFGLSVRTGTSHNEADVAVPLRRGRKPGPRVSNRRQRTRKSERGATPQPNDQHLNLLPQEANARAPHTGRGAKKLHCDTPHVDTVEPYNAGQGMRRFPKRQDSSSLAGANMKAQSEQGYQRIQSPRNTVNFAGDRAQPWQNLFECQHPLPSECCNDTDSASSLPSSLGCPPWRRLSTVSSATASTSDMTGRFSNCLPSHDEQLYRESNPYAGHARTPACSFEVCPAYQPGSSDMASSRGSDTTVCCPQEVCCKAYLPTAKASSSFTLPSPNLKPIGAPLDGRTASRPAQRAKANAAIERTDRANGTLHPAAQPNACVAPDHPKWALTVSQRTLRRRWKSAAPTEGCRERALVLVSSSQQAPVCNIGGTHDWVPRCRSTSPVMQEGREPERDLSSELRLGPVPAASCIGASEHDVSLIASAGGIVQASSETLASKQEVSPLEPQNSSGVANAAVGAVVTPPFTPLPEQPAIGHSESVSPRCEQGCLQASGAGVCVGCGQNPAVADFNGSVSYAATCCQSSASAASPFPAASMPCTEGSDQVLSFKSSAPSQVHADDTRSQPSEQHCAYFSTAHFAPYLPLNSVYMPATVGGPSGPPTLVYHHAMDSQGMTVELTRVLLHPSSGYASFGPATIGSPGMCGPMTVMANVAPPSMLPDKLAQGAGFCHPQAYAHPLSYVSAPQRPWNCHPQTLLLATPPQ